MNRFILFFLIIPVAFTACIPESVDIDIPQAKTQLVLSSQMVSEDLLLVHVSKSFGSLEFSEEAGDSLSNDFLSQLVVEHAKVELSYSGGTESLFHLGQGFYAGIDLDLREQEFYQLQVKDSTTGLEAFASSQVLPATEWEEIDYSFIEPDDFSEASLELRAAFKDFPTENYYMINAYRFSAESQVELNILSNTSQLPTYIYSDQLFQENIIRDTLTLEGYQPGDTVAFALSHISKDYYNYLSTRERSGSSLFANLLREPVNFPTHVEGGFGFFNLNVPKIEIRILD